MSGHGVYVWHTGAVYEGNWQNDEMEGIGSYTYPNGKSYHGEFRRNKRHGKGRLLNKHGKVLYDGLWVDDKQYDGDSVAPFKNHTTTTVAAAVATNEAKAHPETDEAETRVGDGGGGVSGSGGVGSLERVGELRRRG